MQEKENCVVLVDYNLLNFEKGFEKLREKLINLDLTHLSSFDEFYYDSDNDKVDLKHHFFTPDFSMKQWMEDMTNKGYVFISFNFLKKYLSL